MVYFVEAFYFKQANTVKTFENFSYSPINEEEEFLKALWQKVTNFFSGLRDKAAKEVAEKVKSELESCSLLTSI